MKGLPLLRRLFAGIQAVDRADWSWLQWIPAAWKRRLVKAAFRSADAVLTQGEPVELDGLRWSIPESLRGTFVLRHHEPGVRSLLGRLLCPGMVFVDVGANIGYHTVFAARRVGPGGKVYAVEADADNLEHLRENLRLNRVEPGLVEVLPVAAGAVRRRRRFHRRPDAGHHGLYPHPTEETLAIVEVEERPLDELIGGPVDLVKIDVEAGELEALDGMERLLRESPRIRLMVEWNPPLMEAAGLRPEALPERLSALGFDLSVIEGPRGALRALDLRAAPPEEGVDLLAVRV